MTPATEEARKMAAAVANRLGLALPYDDNFIAEAFLAAIELGEMRERETATLHVGSLTLSEGFGGPQRVAITQASGEGGDFPVAAVEAALQVFYKANF